MPVSTKTVVELDLVGYSTIAAALEGGLSVETSLALNQQIQGFIDQGLKVTGVGRDSSVMQTTGDGAILVFDQPSLAHTFADAVHQAARAHSVSKSGIGKRVFRIGVATGEVMMEPNPGGLGFDIGGIAIARAVRLEAKARPGEVLCDAATFAGLPRDQRIRYSTEERVPGKRDEEFVAHRAILNPDGVKDAEAIIGPPAAVVATAGASPRTSRSGKGIKREILGHFEKLKTLKFGELLIRLEVPIRERPSELQTIEERKNKLIDWADETGQLDDLLAELRELVEE